MFVTPCSRAEIYLLCEGTHYLFLQKTGTPGFSKTSAKCYQATVSQIPEDDNLQFFLCMEPEGSLPHSQMPATCLYSEPAQSSPYPHILLLEDNINMDLQEAGCGVWAGLSWLRIETGGGHL
jgi:hypothetical protein